MATLIKIGNSQGIRIPKAIIEQSQLQEKELEFKVLDEGLLIKPSRKNRQGWQKQFEKHIQLEKEDVFDQAWLDASLTDDEDWEW